jgi:hypothetical protein
MSKATADRKAADRRAKIEAVAAQQQRAATTKIVVAVVVVLLVVAGVLGAVLLASRMPRCHARAFRSWQAASPPSLAAIW